MGSSMTGIMNWKPSRFRLVSTNTRVLEYEEDGHVEDHRAHDGEPAAPALSRRGVHPQAEAVVCQDGGDHHEDEQGSPKA